MTGHDPRLDTGRAALIAQLDEGPPLAKMSGITNREVEIRAYVEAYNDRVGDASLEYLRLALDLLDEARAAPPEADAMERDRPCTCHPDDNPPRPCPRKYAYSECVKAAEADAMERAENLVRNFFWNEGIPPDKHEIMENIARALTEYGDQRVSEAIALTTSAERIQAYGDQRAREAFDRAAIADQAAMNEITRKVRGEARAAAIEEAAQLLESRIMPEASYGYGHKARPLGDLAAIRALADTPPQREAGLAPATEAIETARREARATALEEAAQIVERWFGTGVRADGYEAIKEIRALANTPPQSEGGEG